MLIISCIIFISLYADIARGNEIFLQTDRLKTAQANENIYINIGSQTVLLNQPLQIKLVDYLAEKVECCHHRHLEQFPVNTSKRYDIYTTISTEQNVTKWMSGTWKCDVLELNPPSDNRRWRYIYFDINISDNKPPQTILINNIILTPTKQDSNNFKVNYYYEDGDTVDILCVSNKHDNFSLQWSYDGFDSDYGPKSKLEVRHNNTYIVCTCTRFAKPKISLTVTFKLQNLKDNMHLEINDVKAKQTFLKQDNQIGRQFYVNYGYFSNNTLNIINRLDSSRRVDILTVRIDATEERETLDEKTKFTLKIIPSIFSRITFYMNSTIKSNVIETIIITFTHIIPDQNTVIRKRINVLEVTSIPTENTTEKIYTKIENGSQWLPIIIGIIVIVVLIVISTIIYKKIKRTLMQQESDNHLYTNEFYNSSQTSPEQSNLEAVYMDPDKLINHKISTEHQKLEDNTHSVPDAKYEKPQYINNTNYQNLQTSPNSDPVKEIYAKVLINNKKKEELTYANISKHQTEEFGEEQQYCNNSISK